MHEFTTPAQDNGNVSYISGNDTNMARSYAEDIQSIRNER
jgi:hypothetical protein